MHSYSSSAQGGATCPCGVFHAHNAHCSSAYDAHYSSVDCTLSLGPPSTTRRPSSDRPRLSSAFCWDFLQTTSSSNKHPKSSTAVAGGGGDSGLSRRCANCDTTSTPLWRNGPRGPKSLCNACGIRYKKEERRAAATSAASSGGIVMMDAASHVAGYGYPSPWGAHHHPGQKGHYMTAPTAPGNEFRFINDDVVSESGREDLQFLSSWRLNVTDRPTSQLVYDFTR